MGEEDRGKENSVGEEAATPDPTKAGSSSPLPIGRRPSRCASCPRRRP